jgi:hypothetical protein
MYVLAEEVFFFKESYYMENCCLYNIEVISQTSSRKRGFIFFLNFTVLLDTCRNDI